jgi:hypothetical protein
MPMTPRRLLAFLVAFAAATAVPLAAAAAVSRTPVDSATPSSWAAEAAADGVRVQVVVNDFLVVSNIVDAGGPSAQAVVDAFGDSRAYAAYPYPGEIVLTAHGLSQGAAPKYPLIAQSDPTQPNSDVTNGPLQLHARSSDDTSTAAAQGGADGGEVTVATTLSTATASHDTSSGAVTADAETTAEGVSIAGILSIGRVHSHAQMSAMIGSPVRHASDTEVADVTVGGQQVGLTDKGLVLAGTSVPLPPDSTANALLKSSGIAVHYLAPLQTETSTVAPGFSVAASQNVPGVGETTVTYVFGQASASAQATGAADAAGVSASVGVGSNGGTTTPAASGTPGSVVAPGSAVAPGALPSTGDIGGSAPAAAPVTAGAPANTSNGYSLAASTGASSASLYVVIAGGAIVMVAAAQLFRILAVKLAWT